MRNRMIKKEFWHSHRILSISPYERLMFIAMFNVADDDDIGLTCTLFPRNPPELLH